MNHAKRTGFFPFLQQRFQYPIIKVAVVLVCDYLVEMLSSFARTNSGIIYWKERGTWHKRRFSDIDLDDMVEWARIIDPEMRPALYKRIADIALFLSGIFPEHAVHPLGSRKTIFSAKHTLKDYEQVPS